MSTCRACPAEMAAHAQIPAEGVHPSWYLHVADLLGLAASRIAWLSASVDRTDRFFDGAFPADPFMRGALAAELEAFEAREAAS